jgi:hypothetical protein
MRAAAGIWSADPAVPSAGEVMPRETAVVSPAAAGLCGHSRQVMTSAKRRWWPGGRVMKWIPTGGRAGEAVVRRSGKWGPQSLTDEYRRGGGADRACFRRLVCNVLRGGFLASKKCIIVQYMVSANCGVVVGADRGFLPRVRVAFTLHDESGVQRSAFAFTDSRPVVSLALWLP